MINSLFGVDGKVALVTGGSRGIGLMIARGFVTAGVRTYISARTAEDCESAAAELAAAGTCIALPADCATEAGCLELARAVEDREPALHILVNNAGATWVAPLEQHDDAAWNRVLDLNLKGLFHLTRFLLPLLRAASRSDDPARVVNIGSIDGLSTPALAEFAYASSKAAVHHLTRHLAKELAPDITVNAIAPGAFESRMTEDMLSRYRDEIVAAAPLRRIGRSDDMAGTAIFLAARAGSYLTGAVIPVDGGLATTA
jgi:NAD(P)-dependent dehydrogenase (short-subunit alcohol dehydrogenase family)